MSVRAVRPAVVHSNKDTYLIKEFSERVEPLVPAGTRMVCRLHAVTSTESVWRRC